MVHGDVRFNFITTTDGFIAATGSVTDGSATTRSASTRSATIGSVTTRSATGSVTTRSVTADIGIFPRHVYYKKILNLKTLLKQTPQNKQLTNYSQTTYKLKHTLYTQLNKDGDDGFSLQPSYCVRAQCH